LGSFGHLLTQFSDIKTIGSAFWTSGADEGEFCDTLDVHNWCASDQKQAINLTTDLWANRTVSAANRCHTFRFNTTAKESTGLQLSACNQTNFYICEVVSQTVRNCVQ